MNTPNQEQIQAIQHQGGVLLKAGAGSGKTFVLVEHVIDLTRGWRKIWESKRDGSFSEYIATQFSSTVLMTFTKLAAGEILVRLTNRFQQEIKKCDETEKAWWKESLSQIDRLSVTTIDGFFYKLVRRGYFPSLPSELEIIMSGPRKKRIVSLFDMWWEKNSSSMDLESLRDTAMYRSALCETLLAIFNDPSLRDSWMQFSIEDAYPAKLDWLALELPALEGWNDFLKLESVEVPPSARAKANKWVELADALNSKIVKNIQTWDDILDWAQFAESEVGKTRLVLGGSKELVGYYFEEWKIFKDSVKQWGQVFSLYQANFEKRILPWLKTLTHLVTSINKQLNPNDGITYGDLEYYVLKGVRDPKISQKIRNDFKYFVVDEFQDTSRVQYEILSLLVGSDSNRLFCVGDAKQAIYGFRGGELQVFNDVQNSAGIRTLMLSANYRSLPKVVEFNNSFFNVLFPIGLSWKGQDSHAVEMEPQTISDSGRGAGSVELLEVSLPSVLEVDPSQINKKTPKWKTTSLHLAEAVVISQSIERKLIENPNVNVAILYKKLAPAKFLMNELMSKGIGFTAQAKIPFKEDPVAGILLALIEDMLGKKEQNWCQFMIAGYLDLLRIKSNSLVASCTQFKLDLDLYGPLEAFELFLWRLNVSLSLSQNMVEIREILSLGSGDLEAIAIKLKSKGEESWSADFRFGDNSHRVIIQTSHGSKGLQYDIVYVGGLATNGKARSKQDWIGSLPGAALWVEDPSSRKRTQTPQLLFEKSLKTQKDFAESKRLFYVACTRAIYELVMIRFVSAPGELTLDKSSWAMGLESYLEKAGDSLLNRIPIQLKKESFKESDSSKPFFHINPLGITLKSNIDDSTHFGVTSELSVTGLNSLLECPRKFYFKNILKIHEDEFENEASMEAWGGEREVRPISSSARGSDIHLALSQAVSQNFVLPLKWLNHKDKVHMDWALNELKQICPDPSQLVSEAQMKFPFFGFMLTGIPDLVVHSKSVEIWDYKTGRRNHTSELKYWQQLMIYAYAHWSTGLVSLDSTLVLRLCYVDSHELPTKEVCFNEVQEALFPIWSKLSNLAEIETSHCSSCPYTSVCPL
ncbi:MAG: UvrD-helicase domain-containing protein [Bacteriovoracaceae bacterium]|nr:UvrD-helicase domain-containing protein [Bacteriovoracaceae bacterium]